MINKITTFEDENYLLKSLDTSSLIHPFEIQKTQFLNYQIRKQIYKTLGTRIIYIPMPLPPLLKIIIACRQMPINLKQRQTNIQPFNCISRQ